MRIVSKQIKDRITQVGLRSYLFTRVKLGHMKNALVGDTNECIIHITRSYEE